MIRASKFLPIHPQEKAFGKKALDCAGHAGARYELASDCHRRVLSFRFDDERRARVGIEIALDEHAAWLGFEDLVPE